MSPLARKIDKKFTYKDYCSWPDDERWELIDGIAYNMSPAPSRQHQELSRELFARLYDVLKDKECETYYAPFDVRLPDTDTAEEDQTFTVVQPDIVVVCDLSKLDDRGCKGAPDLIIEILSPSTAAKDLKIKRDLYERHGVKEYWLVHPTDKTVMIYNSIVDDNQYGKADVYAGEDIIVSQVIEGLKINLIDVFGPLPPAVLPESSGGCKKTKGRESTNC